MGSSKVPCVIVLGIFVFTIVVHLASKSYYRNGINGLKPVTDTGTKENSEVSTKFLGNEITSVIYEKKQPIEIKCRIATYDRHSWQCLENDACQKKDDFIIGYMNYNKRKKKIPLYLHPPENDVHISRVLFNGGAWEKDLLNKMETVMSNHPTATFIDIGAHIGVYSITMASLGYETVAIDCYRANVERICASEMVGRKLGTKLHIVHNAVSDKHETVGIRRSSENNVGGNYVESTGTDTSGSISKDYIEYVDTILIDDLLTRFDIKSAVIKIDAQGNEHKILKGADTFFRVVNVLYVQMEFNLHRKSPSGYYIHGFMKKHRFTPILPPEVSLSNLTQWPWDVIWVKNI